MSDDRFFSGDQDVGLTQAAATSKGSVNLNKSYKATYMSAGYDGKVTTVRPLPYFDKSAPGMPEVPYRRGERFSPWYRSYPAIRSVGQSAKLTILLNDPVKNKMWDQNSNPAWVLRNEINKAVNFGKKPGSNGLLPDNRKLFTGNPLIPPYWYGIVDGGPGRSAELPYITSVVLFEALVYQHYMKKDMFKGYPIGLRDEDGAVVFELTGSFWTNSILSQINQTVPGYSGDMNNFEAAYVNGDPVSLRTGRFLHIVRKDSDPRVSAMPVNPQDMYSSQQDQKKSGEMEGGYCGFFSRTLPGYPNDNGSMTAALQWDDPNYAHITQRIKDRWVPLEELIQVPTPMEQAALLTSVFNPEILLYAWERHPQFITDALRAKAAAAGTIIVETQPQVTSPAANTPGWGPFSQPNQPTHTQPSPQAMPGGAYQQPQPAPVQPMSPAVAAPASTPAPVFAPPVSNPAMSPVTDPTVASLPSAAQDFPGFVANQPAPPPGPASMPGAPPPPVSTPVYSAPVLPGMTAGAPPAFAPPGPLPQPAGVSNLEQLRQAAAASRP